MNVLLQNRMRMRILLVAALLVCLPASQICAVDSFGNEFYVPLWAGSETFRDVRCLHLFQTDRELLQILYISTQEPSNVSVMITFTISNGTYTYDRQYPVVVRVEQPVIFNVLSTFSKEIDKVSFQNHSWWVDQPVHVKAADKMLVSIFGMSTVRNITSIFPAYPIPSPADQHLDYYHWNILTVDLTPTERTVASGFSMGPSLPEVLVLKPLYSSALITIEPEVDTFVLCRLRLGYVGKCSTTLQPVLFSGKEYPTTPNQTDAIVLVATDDRSSSNNFSVPVCGTFAHTDLYTMKPSVVYLARVGEIECRDPNLASAAFPTLTVQQQMYVSNTGYTFIIITHQMKLGYFKSLYSNITGFGSEWYSAKYHHATNIDYHIWSSASDVQTGKFDTNILRHDHPQITALIKEDTVAVMITVDAGGTLQMAKGYYDPNSGQYSAYTTIPAVEQYRNSYVLPDPRSHLPLVQQEYSDSNTTFISFYIITVIVPAEHFGTGDVILDGEQLEKDRFLTFRLDDQSPAFYITEISLPFLHERSTHTVSHSNSRAQIGVSAFGFLHDLNDSFVRNVYAFSGGLKSTPDFSITESDNVSTRTISSATGASIGFILVLAVVVIFHRVMKRRQGGKNRSHGYRFLHTTDCSPWLEPRREPDGSNCQYDVFLSFADEDLPFVETYIYQQLEESGFQVCWHHRDFLPGYSIIENIKNSIDRSRRVLFVLSEHFHRSEYCLFELRYSCEKMLASHTQFVIPLVLHQGSLPRELDHMTYWKFDPQQPDPRHIESFIKTLGSPIQPES